jgi:hypothetical protein
MLDCAIWKVTLWCCMRQDVAIFKLKYDKIGYSEQLGYIFKQVDYVQNAVSNIIWFEIFTVKKISIV